MNMDPYDRDEMVCKGFIVGFVLILVGFGLGVAVSAGFY